MIAAYGMQRIADMSRSDLIKALNEMCWRYRLLHENRMITNEVPVFHEDMDAWNDKLAEWFDDPTTKTNPVAQNA